jgi:predicted O-linked N-acetylglucosamine transferase (SPINDLY family)
LQIIALGHPATTHSDKIDFVVVEEDYIGEKNCFSEDLIILPKDGMPYRPSRSLQNLNLRTVTTQNSKDQVDICVAATTMKLNPGFLTACQQIKDRSKIKTHFHFLVGQAIGLTIPNVERVIKSYLGDSVTLYPHQPYQKYMGVIEKMDLFINPFPFGNTNGIIDTISAGLVGICKTGPEVHEHIDEGLFKRLGLPEWLITETEDDYVKAAVRLANAHEERFSLRQQYTGADKVNLLFEGRTQIMGEKFLEVLEASRTHTLKLKRPKSPSPFDSQS